MAFGGSGTGFSFGAGTRAFSLVFCCCSLEGLVTDVVSVLIRLEEEDKPWKGFGFCAFECQSSIPFLARHRCQPQRFSTSTSSPSFKKKKLLPASTTTPAFGAPAATPASSAAPPAFGAAPAAGTTTNAFGGFGELFRFEVLLFLSFSLSFNSSSFALTFRFSFFFSSPPSLLLHARRRGPSSDALALWGSRRSSRPGGDALPLRGASSDAGDRRRTLWCGGGSPDPGDALAVRGPGCCRRRSLRRCCFRSSACCRRRSLRRPGC